MQLPCQSKSQTGSETNKVSHASLSSPIKIDKRELCKKASVCSKRAGPSTMGYIASAVPSAIGGLD